MEEMKCKVFYLLNKYYIFIILYIIVIIFLFFNVIIFTYFLFNKYKMEISKIQTVRTSNHQMMSMDDCFDNIKSLISKLNKIGENIETRNTINRINTSNIYSPINIPETRKSTMDGYSLNLDSINLNQNIIVIDKVFAGKSTNEGKESVYDRNFDKTNKCVYITTGASVPDWCDTIIPIEFTLPVIEKNKYEIKIIDTFKPTKNKFIREIGSDLKKCDLVLHSNSIVNCSDITMLLSCTISHINVYKQPTIGLISTVK